MVHWLVSARCDVGEHYMCVAPVRHRTHWVITVQRRACGVDIQLLCACGWVGPISYA